MAVFREAARPLDPGKDALDDPAFEQHLKRMLLVAFYDPDRAAEPIFCPVDQLAVLPPSVKTVVTDSKRQNKRINTARLPTPRGVHIVPAKGETSACDRKEGAHGVASRVFVPQKEASPLLENIDETTPDGRRINVKTGTKRRLFSALAAAIFNAQTCQRVRTCIVNSKLMAFVDWQRLEKLVYEHEIKQ